MTIPASIVTDLYDSTASIFAGSLPLIIIFFGIGIAFYIVRQLANLFPKS